MTFDSAKGKIGGYLARLKDKGRRPAVLVIHENRGLNPHIEDVARRIAAEGFLAHASIFCRFSAARPRAKMRRALFTRSSIRTTPWLCSPRRFHS